MTPTEGGRPFRPNGWAASANGNAGAGGADSSGAGGGASDVGAASASTTGSAAAGRISQAVVATRAGSINVLALPERDREQVAFEVQGIAPAARYASCQALHVTVDGATAIAPVANHSERPDSGGVFERVVAASMIDVVRRMASGHEVTLRLCDGEWALDATARSRLMTFLQVHANRLGRSGPAGPSPAAAPNEAPAPTELAPTERGELDAPME